MRSHYEQSLAILVLLLAGAELQAAATRQKYIVLFKQPNASAAAAINAAVPAGGGSIEARGLDRVLVSLPDGAVQGVRKLGGVKYVQRAVVGKQANTPPAADANGGRLAAEASSRRLQPVAQWASGAYSYDGAGNITAIGADSYTYDPLSRLTGATVSGHTVSYAYDGYGNMTSRTTDQQTVTRSVDGDNHIGGASYDTAGNVTGEAGETYGYDAFNNMVEKTANSTQELYLYTASDERIGVRTGSERWLWSLRDESGQVLRQYESFQSSPEVGWTWVEDYVYREGGLLGAERMPEEGGRRHFHLDHLGTPRLITGNSGQIVAAHDYYPFGDEITTATQETGQGFSRDDPMKFTGQERDLTPGTPYPESSYLDYMHARFASSGWGRFLSVDPVLGNLHRPQTWNRYAYVLNNPLRYTDPTGMATSDVHCDNSGCSITVTPDGPPPPTESELSFWAELTAPIIMNGRAARDFYSQHSNASSLNGNDLAAGVYDLTGDVLDIWALINHCSPNVKCGTVMIGNLSGPAGESLVGHIFRSAPGHVNPSTLASQGRFASLFESVASNPANLRQGALPAAAEAVGVRMYTQTFANGQVWVTVRGNTIVNAGVNAVGSFR